MNTTGALSCGEGPVAAVIDWHAADLGGPDRPDEEFRRIMLSMSTLTGFGDYHKRAVLCCVVAMLNSDFLTTNRLYYVESDGVIGYEYIVSRAARGALSRSLGLPQSQPAN